MSKRKNKVKRDISKDGKMRFKIDVTKYKMDEEELKNHLHCKRKGSNVKKSAKAYSRNKKHKERYI